MVGKLERVPLREVWKHEAHDFTTWLRDNIEILAEVLGIALAEAENEQPAGDFSIDIVAQDEEGEPVVIENQLGKSDHDHLGKLITYVTAFEGSAAVWIVAEPRAEHVKAIAWLNEFSPTAFYLVKIEAIRIGGSEAAPLLTLIVGPSDEAKSVGATRTDMNEADRLRTAFWEGLLERARERTRLHASISPRPSGWIWAATGTPGLNLNYVIKKHSASVGLHIDRGEGEDAVTQGIYEQLQAHRSEVEAAIDEPLDWGPPQGKRSAWIGIDLGSGGYRDDREKWPEIQDEMIDAMIRLEKALRPYLDALEV